MSKTFGTGTLVLIIDTSDSDFYVLPWKMFNIFGHLTSSASVVTSQRYNSRCVMDWLFLYPDGVFNSRKS